MTQDFMLNSSTSPRRSALSWVALSLTLPLVLAGCSLLQGNGGPRTPTAGDRTSILSNDNALKPDDTLQGMAVLLPAPEVNADWAQSGGNAEKSMGHVALPHARTRAWQASVKGNSKTMRLAAAPVVANGTLVAVGTDAAVTAFDASTGARKWSRNIGSTSSDLRRSTFGGGAAIDNSIVYATSGTGDVAALSLTDGSVVWKVRPAGVLRGAPTVAFGSVYVMTQDNQLLSLNAADGAVQWQKAASLEPGSMFGAGSPAAGQSTIVAGYASGEVNAYRYENGRDLWDDALARTSIALSVAMLTDVDADPVIDRGRVFALGQGGRMASYDLGTGQRIWELSIAGVSTPWVAGDWVFVVTDDARLLCVHRATGKIRWITQLQRFRVDKAKTKKDPIRWSGPILAGGYLILVNTQGQVIDVSPESGVVMARNELPGATTHAPVVANNMIYLLDDSGRITAWR